MDGEPLGERKHWLNDDYVKFIRFGQWHIERTGQGVLAFVTNHGYLDNRTFRGMRQSLTQTFTDIYLLDLHGSSKKVERSPEDSKDENVFDIQQGIAIGIFVKKPNETGPAKVHHVDLWGLREGKYGWLTAESIETTEWVEVNPGPPSHLFAPSDTDLLEEYEEAWKVPDVFPVNSAAIQTSRDGFVIDFDADSLLRRIAALGDDKYSDSELRARYNLQDGRNWTLSGARARIRKRGARAEDVKPVLYRLFDERFLFYTNELVNWPRRKVMDHMVDSNLALVTVRQLASLPFDHVWVADKLTDQHVISVRTKEGAAVTPLYLYPQSDNLLGAAEEHRRPNLSPAFTQELSEKLGLRFIPDGKGDLAGTFGPEAVFYYAYAIFHSPAYRERYAEFLKRDFPRLPLTSDRALFAALVAKGRELVGLHLMSSPTLDHLVTRFPESGDNAVEKVRYDSANRRVYINKQQYFDGVPEEVWGFRVGGYQVLDKWLKDRRGRTLSFADVQHYQRIVVALVETRRLMREIDEMIPGWPLS